MSVPGGTPTHSILLGGLPTRLSTWLAQRIPDSLVEVAFGRDDVLSLLDDGDWSLLVIDSWLDDLPVEDLVTRIRAQRRFRTLPIAVVLDPLERPRDLQRVDALVQRHGVDRVFFHPVDPGEVARFAMEGAPDPTGESAPAAEPEAAPLAAGLAQVWTRSRAASLDRAGIIARAAAAAGRGRLDRAERDQAGQEAHRLAGLLGTLGLHEGTRLAAAAEALLRGERALDAAAAAELARLAAQLATAIEAHQVTAAAAPAPSGPVRTLRLFTSDPQLRGVATAAAGTCGLAVVEADTAGEAPAAVLVELRADDEGAWRTLQRCATAWPGVPVLVAATRDSLLDRVRAVQMGVTSVLPLPADGAALTGALRRAAPAAQAAGPRVLSLDDDTALQEALRALLSAQGMTVLTESDPAEFWARLAEQRPDLVILDVEMPRLNGVEVCRVLRADPRYQDLPVLFLTARSDRDTVYRVFAAGADDYVPKPVVGPELVARIRNRLGRRSG